MCSVPLVLCKGDVIYYRYPGSNKPVVEYPPVGCYDYGGTFALKVGHTCVVDIYIYIYRFRHGPIRAESSKYCQPLAGNIFVHAAPRLVWGAVSIGGLTGLCGRCVVIHIDRH